MKCPHCGSPTAPNSTVCTQCMTPLPVGAPGSASPSHGVASSGAAAAPAIDETITGTGRESRATPSRSNPTARRSSESLEIGTVLANRYEIVRIIGAGGMGAVYQARDVQLNRVVALKVIRPDLAKDPETVSRFKQELILARQVTHKNVIRIYDLAEFDGLKFINMDFIDGRDLKTVLREKGKFEPRKAAEIIEQVCRGLEAAHSEAVIHRDLKPQNIMMDRSGKVTVMDFGIARSIAPRVSLDMLSCRTGSSYAYIPFQPVARDGCSGMPHSIRSGPEHAIKADGLRSSSVRIHLSCRPLPTITNGWACEMRLNKAGS